MFAWTFFSRFEVRFWFFCAPRQLCPSNLIVVSAFWCRAALRTIINRFYIPNIMAVVITSVFKDTVINFMSLFLHLVPRNSFPGSASSRNTPFWIKTSIPSVGPRMVSPDLKAPTTAALAPTRCTAATSWRLTTEPASTPESTFLEPTLKSCPHRLVTSLVFNLIECYYFISQR